MNREKGLTSELIQHVIHRMRDEQLGLYPAMRILGYVLVGVAEGLDLEGKNDASE